MSHASDLSGMLVIDDSFAVQSLSGERGYQRRSYDIQPLGYGPYSKKFEQPELSDSERRERIKEREAKKMRNIDMARHAGVMPYNQSSTNFCWANSVTILLELQRADSNRQHVRLSAASVACKITGFRNVGGWCSQALDYVCKYGAAPQSLWPANTIDRRYDTEETQKARMEFRVDEYDDIEPKNVGRLIDYLLLVGPAACAAMWWQHATTAMDPVIMQNGSFGILHYNSGYGRDANGLTVLTGSKAIPDEVVGVRTTDG